MTYKDNQQICEECNKPMERDDDGDRYYWFCSDHNCKVWDKDYRG